MSLEAVSRAEALNADLRRRLEEAEEVIRAIREGEIDALVVRNQKREEEIFTLEGGVESYRSFMEAMDLGAAAFDGHANLLYANQALCDLFAVSRDALDAKLLFEAIGAEASAVIAALIEKPTSGAAGVQIKLGQGEAATVATSKDECKKGGWADLTRADGSSFKNQGDCIQYVNTGK